MTGRSYRVTFPNRVLRVWTFEMPDGKLEQYQVAPVGLTVKRVLTIETSVDSLTVRRV